MWLGEKFTQTKKFWKFLSAFVVHPYNCWFMTELTIEFFIFIHAFFSNMLLAYCKMFEKWEMFVERIHEELTSLFDVPVCT